MDQGTERLRAAIEGNTAVLVVGTGVSRALSGNAAPADWIGLIESGIDRATDLGEPPEWRDLQKQSLEFARSAGDVDALLGVASQVQRKLAQKGHAYVEWLSDEVGRLTVVDASVAEALASLASPILTTNYDTLVEQALVRPSAHWQGIEGVRDTLRGGPAVAHLHGIWTEPATVILSSEDYGRLRAARGAQFLQSAHYATKSFIFVGYGAGLEDPNFGGLLDFHRELFPDSRGEHFRLSLETDVEELSRAHAGDDIKVVAYGSKHADLAPFLASLAPTRRASAAVSHDRLAFAREALAERVRSEAIVGEHVVDVDQREIVDLTIPPVLLPMPHEQFVSERELDEELRPKRIDPETAYLGSRVLILAGEELSGVTTALAWILCNAADSRPGYAPLVVDARTCTINTRALDRQVRREALAHRLIDRKNDPLPPHVLAVDNVKPQSTKAYESMIDDLKSSSAAFIVLGCRQGDEIQIAADLAGHLLGVEVAYLGKLASREIAALATILAPGRADDLSKEVLGVIRREHLPRSPFTVSLLLVLFAQGTKSLLNNSETAVLNDYVNLLLGRKGQFLDPRWSLDPQNREVVLSELAKAFVRRRRGALSQHDAVDLVERLFSSLEWPDSAMDVLQSFREMRLLRIDNEVVQFSQSSYLHLFAAKAAIADDDFLTELLEDAVYFAPIVRHYAALVRNSERVVSAMAVLFDKWAPTVPEGRIFGEVQLRPAPEDTEHELPDESSSPEKSKEPDPPEDEDTNAAEVVDEYDYSDDADSVAFPLEEIETWARTSQLSWTLDLASRVLRDSDQIANPDLKSEILELVLNGWGYFLELLERDSVFEPVASAIAKRLVAAGGLEEDRLDAVTDRLRLMLPSFVALAGVSASLSSRKLLRALDRLSKEGRMIDDEYALATAAMLAFDIQEPGWTEYFRAMSKKHGNRWVVADFSYVLASLSYRYSVLKVADERNLVEFAKETRAQRYAFSSEAQRKSWLGKFEQRMRRSRVLHTRDRLQPGENVLEAAGNERPEDG